MRTYPHRILLFLLAAVACVACPSQSRAGEDAGYAVVVSKVTSEDAAWKLVVDALAHKHHAEVIIYDGDVRKALEPLRRQAPRYACFVARPDEAGRDFAVRVNRLTRGLNNDPYTDVLWGILTGYTAEDALRTVQTDRPLMIRKALSGTSAFNLGPFQEGMVFDEGKAKAFVVKTPDGKTETKSCQQDTTGAIADALNRFHPDLVMTSGHASERDWRIGYSYKNGVLRCQDGELFGLDLEKKRHPIESPNPKVYLASGNCLAGHVADRQSMALAWMKSGGVRQMIGYVAVTWYGRGGWGTRDYFFDLPGRYTLAEAFFFNQQLVIHDLVKRFPDRAKEEIQDYSEHGIDREAARLGFHKFDGNAKDCLGLLWDRDAVVLYGDPAWEARLEPHALPLRTELQQQGDVYTLSVLVEKETRPGKPLALFLPHRIREVRVVKGQAFEPLITSRFVMLMKQPEKYEPGKKYQVVFEAKRADVARADGGAPDALALVPASLRERVRKQLETAGENGPKLLAAIRACKEDERPGLAYVLAYMPARDLTSLSGDFLLDQVAYAYRARAEVPWGKAIPEELFLNDVLPYANLNERRDAWRRDFYERFLPLVHQCATPGEAAMKLNAEVFPTFKVRYHATKRPKPDQSPYESVAAGYASCTGLSILLVDACRAVGIPARVAGTPLWSDRSGNHNWVEVWDRHWHFLGAAERGPLDRTWFAGKAAKADPERPEHRIYAASFRRGELSFPLVWDPKIRYVGAVDVTMFYTARRSVRFRVVEMPGGPPVAARLTVRLGEQVVAEDAGGLSGAFDLAGEQSYDVEVQALDRKTSRNKHVTIGAEREQVVEIALRSE